jgi:photosystem II stability/assembly factor-like uncharacterized protein
MTPIRILLAVLLLSGIAPAQIQLEKTLKNLKFREIGPAIMGGRIDDVAVVESNPSIIYLATASGGLWKTTNSGITWFPIFDNEAVSTIGDVTLAPSDPSIVWVGTGEQNNRQSSSWGNGVYKSTDAGKTWQNMGLKDSHHIGRIVIHPANPNVVYVAALGKLWGPNAERGVYKTSDGGKTWTQSLKINDDTGVVDIAMDPESPDILYAAAYQRRRTPFGFNGGGPGSGLYKSTNGGATWTKLTKGLPEGGDTGRIGIAIYRKNPSIVYVLYQHERGGIYRSEDRGENFVRMSDTNPRPSYYSQVHIDPNNDQRIWVLGANMFFSEDGGRTFRQNVFQKIHGDYHALWINPANSDHMITGSDGGIHLTFDRGRSWMFQNTIPLGQFYEIAADMQRPYRICGGLQDNNSWCGPSATLDSRGISNDEWITTGGGDGFYAAFDPKDPDLVYAESQDGNLLRRNLRTHESKSIRPREATNEPRYRFQWNSPVVVSNHDPKTIFYGGNFLFKSSDRGDTWKKISPDLTTGVERDKQPIMGQVPDGKTLSRHDGVQAFPAITTLSESPVRSGVLWVGTDDGNLQVSRDGETWKNVVNKVPGVPKGTYVSRVIASKFAEGTAYVTFDGHRTSDFGIYAYMTTDFGETWTKITNGIPENGGSLNVIREHPRNANLLFAGGEYGLYVSLDKGKNWQELKLNLPRVPVDDIQIHPRENDLILGTHGRSIWILDDITPLEKLTEQIAAADFGVFEPRPAIAWRMGNRKASTGHAYFIGPNPTYGAVLTYHLKNRVEARDSLKVEILDSAGGVVRTLDNPPREAGMQRVAWDLRYNRPSPPTPQEIEMIEQFGAENAGFFGGGARGPRVEPGKYAARFTVNGKVTTVPVVVEEDPRVDLAPADRQLRWKTISEAYDLSKQLETARRRYTNIRDNYTAMMERYRTVSLPAPAKAAADEFGKKLDALRGKWMNPQQGGLGDAGPPLTYTPPPIPQQLSRLMNSLDGFAAAPSQTQVAELTEIKQDAATAMAAVDKLASEDLPKLNKAMNDAAVPFVTEERPANAAPQQRRRGGE